MKPTGHDRRVRTWGLALGGAIAVVAAPLAYALASSSSGPGPTVPVKGSIPSAAVIPGQPINKALVPQYIPALDQAGNQVGYVSKDLAIDGPTSAPITTPIPVYASDLRTIVGYMVAGRGFVPKGTSVDSLPSLAPTPSAEPS